MKKIVIVFVLMFSASLYAQSELEIEKKIDQLLPQLTLKEKVALCHAQSRFSIPGVPRLGVPELWMTDGPHGVRPEFDWNSWDYAGWTNDSVTAFPALTCLAATFNTDLAFRYGEAIGEEARFREKDVLLGPGVNIYRTPLNGRNFEYMGEDPYLAGEMGAYYVIGVQKNGVAACVKHFAANNQENKRLRINVKVSDRALQEIYLPAFKATIEKGGAWSVMGAYNQVKEDYCCQNAYLLNSVLKSDWGFDGCVISDWGGAHDTKKAAYNGLDIEMGSFEMGPDYLRDIACDDYYLATPFYNMLKDGDIDESVVDEKVRRILRLILRTAMNPNKPWGSLNTEAHQKTAYDVAKEGIVLLKNDKFFPIDKETKQTIAVIGENATRSVILGGGSSDLKALYEVSPLEGIRKTFKKATVLHSMGYSSGESVFVSSTEPEDDQDSLFQAALKVAEKADIVVFVGGLNKNRYQDCEGADRKIYGLPFNQEVLIDAIAKVNPNIGVVLISGNAVSMPWLNDVDGILQAWYCGNEAGNAIADVISGKVNPSGKLPFSFPVKLQDNAAHYFGEESYPGDGVNVNYKEDILVGYRWFDTKQIKPQFAFGYGLSYTSFELDDIMTDKKMYAVNDSIVVSCKIKNTGDVDGKEVVQVYVGKPKSEVARAVKELKGFGKKFLAAGNQTEVQIKIAVADLKYYDETSHDWVLESGKYIVYVGNSSDNIAKAIKIEIK